MMEAVDKHVPKIITKTVKKIFVLYVTVHAKHVLNL